MRERAKVRSALSQRELEALRLVAKATNAEIAEALHLSERTASPADSWGTVRCGRALD